MNKIDLFYGFIIGVTASLLGCFIFIESFTQYSFTEGIKIMSSKGFLGKIIALGAVMNLIAFFVLLKLKKDLMARGVILATIVLTAITLFV